MSNPSRNSHEIEDEISYALISIHHRRFADAQRHIHAAENFGANKYEMEHALNTLDQSIRTSQKRAARMAWLGPLIAIFAYLVISSRSPQAWTFPLWALLTLGLIPAGIGWLVGREIGPEKKMGQRIRSGYWTVGTAMFLYTIVSLMIIRSHIGIPDASGMVFLVELFVSSAYTIIAGGVAGLVAAHLAWRWDKYEKGNHA